MTKLNKKKSKTENLDISQYQLLTESTKLRSIAHLIESQADLGCVPLDLDQINTGLGLLLNECAGRIREIAKQLD